ncbi:MAG TPA: hypothetical protein VII59_15230 [Streptosporangiaceae bacterium]
MIGGSTAGASLPQRAAPAPLGLPRSWPSAAWRSPAWWPALAGLLLGLLALGPALGRGFVLSYDMVFVPAPPFSSALLGLSGGPARPVPSDAVVAVAARVIPAELLQKLILLAIFVLACSGAAALLADCWQARRGARPPLLASLAAAVFYGWNPYLAERLAMGQWALLLGYAGLPWVLRALCTGPLRIGRARLALALLPAAVGGFGGMVITGLAAAPTALARGGCRSERARRLGVVAAGCVLLSLPWIIPSLIEPVRADPSGASLFAARADTPFGSLGSLALLSGIWNAQAVPVGYGGVSTVCWLLAVAAAAAGYLLRARSMRLCPGLGVAGLIGLAVAALGVTAPGRALLADLISAWAGFAVLRDGQQYVAALALAEAIGLGAAVAWAVRDARIAAAPVLGVLAVLAPVLLLPGMAWGSTGRLHAVQYPADWMTARQLIDSDPQPGTVLLLPWAQYRRYPWNGGEAVFDPWSRLLSRDVIYNDALTVGRQTVGQESAASIRFNRVLGQPGPLTARLRAAGVRYVLVDAGPLPGQPPAGIAAAARLPGSRLVLASRDLVVFLLQGGR